MTFSPSFLSTFVISEDVLSGEVDIGRDLGAESGVSVGSPVSFSGSAGGG